jgi:hypothetical protein
MLDNGGGNERTDWVLKELYLDLVCKKSKRPHLFFIAWGMYKAVLL